MNNEFCYTTNFYNVVKAYNEGYRLIVEQGGQGCFAPNQNIVTKEGLKKISEIKVNDLVLSYNQDTNTNEFKKVINTFRYKPTEKIYRIKLKNGNFIEVTENHKFYHKGDWIKIKHLLS